MIVFIDKCIRYIKKKWNSAVFSKIVGKKVSVVENCVVINKNITVGDNFTVYPNVMFFGDGPIVIGNNVSIGNGTVIYSSSQTGVYIGDNTMIAAYCYITDTDHGVEKNNLIRYNMNTHAKVIIGNDCWIAAGAKILKGANVMDGAVIGAQAVVKGEIPMNAIAVGVPERVIRYRE